MGAPRCTGGEAGAATPGREAGRTCAHSVQSGMRASPPGSPFTVGRPRLANISCHDPLAGKHPCTLRSAPAHLVARQTWSPTKGKNTRHPENHTHPPAHHVARRHGEHLAVPLRRKVLKHLQQQQLNQYEGGMRYGAQISATAASCPPHRRISGGSSSSFPGGHNPAGNSPTCSCAGMRLHANAAIDKHG